MVSKRELDLIVRMRDRASAGFTKLNNKAQTFGKNLISIKSLMVGAFGALAVKQISNMVMAYAKQERAEFQLAQALKKRGVIIKNQMPVLKEYAAELQKQSIYGDEIILENQKLLVSLGNLTGEGLKKATKASIDLASATGMDIRTSFFLMAKAAAGNTEALSRYGLTIDKTIPKNQKFDELLKKINATMGGASEAEANTTYGQIMQNKNAIGDLAEAMGQGFVPIVTSLLKTLGPLVERFAKLLQYTLWINREVKQSGMSEYLENIQKQINQHKDAVNAAKKEVLSWQRMLEKGIISQSVFDQSTQGFRQIIQEGERAIEVLEKGSKLEAAKEFDKIKKSQTPPALANDVSTQTVALKEKNLTAEQEINLLLKKIEIEQWHKNVQMEQAAAEQAEMERKQQLIDLEQMHYEAKMRNITVTQGVVNATGQIAMAMTKDAKAQAAINVMMQIAEGFMNLGRASAATAMGAAGTAAAFSTAATMNFISAAKYAILGGISASGGGRRSAGGGGGGYNPGSFSGGNGGSNGALNVTIHVDTMDAESFANSGDRIANALLDPLGRALEANGGTMGNVSLNYA